jgi:pyridoxamine 5'-phosphate oxidase
MEEVINYLNSVRRDYAGHELDEKSVDKNPFNQLSLWVKEAIDAQVLDPAAMVLSTVDKHGKPSSRVVLMRGETDNGLLFYTDYSSNKSQDLIANPFVAINFFWVELDRQVRLTGRVEKVSREQSVKYFSSRPKESQLAAIASSQSKVLQNRQELENRFEALQEEYKDKEAICPEDWGGFEIVLDNFEFWQGRPSRMHDRIVYTKKNKDWKIERLSP